ncbi:MAG TPA: NAD(P)H-dependent glycerol-3-phosphate dehydrogenase [Acidimicrobiales bacterium]|jgi:glycerol-3-phosphate dehydrogenase (NAD(P)+)|nr:NAD(P)H-dependent glycerol-3-phosphate dehydrogenase [Acidimicrobiales bacterium]
MPMHVAVIGGGSWGTTIAHLCAHNEPTTLWARREEVAAEIRARHTNDAYLPGYALHPELQATSSLEEAVCSADLLVMGVPSHGMRDTARQLASCLRPWVPVVSLSKGLEQGTRLRMTQVLEEELPGHPCGVLTGPNLAKEILAGDAAATVVAMGDTTIAEALQRVFATDLFRVYTNTDVVGCEVAGALKNVMAIASGMADGLGTGDNTRAAVITRGLAELTRLGCAMGGHQVTFAGLAGMGDLIATCISPQSRNRYVGEQLGKGRKIDDIIDEMHMVAEGVKTSRVVMELGAQYGVELPIAQSVHAVIHEGAPAGEVYRGLLGRRARPEMHDMPSS